MTELHGESSLPRILRDAVSGVVVCGSGQRQQVFRLAGTRIPFELSGRKQLFLSEKRVVRVPAVRFFDPKVHSI